MYHIYVKHGDKLTWLNNVDPSQDQIPQNAASDLPLIQLILDTSADIEMDLFKF